MSDINTTTQVGRLTRDAETKYTGGGMCIAEFSLANNYRKKSGDEWIDEVNYFDVVLFGKRAEALAQYLTKGTQLAVSGSLRQDRWEKDGQKRSKVVIVANDIQLLGGKRGASEEDPSDGVPF